MLANSKTYSIGLIINQRPKGKQIAIFGTALSPIICELIFYGGLKFKTDKQLKYSQKLSGSDSRFKINVFMSDRFRLFNSIGLFWYL